jgi:hypothetical protein
MMKTQPDNQLIKLICTQPLPEKGFEWVYEVIAEIEAEKAIVKILTNISLD